MSDDDLFRTTEMPKQAMIRIARETHDPLAGPSALPPELKARRQALLATMSPAFHAKDAELASMLRKGILTPQQAIDALTEASRPKPPDDSWMDKLHWEKRGKQWFLPPTFHNLLVVLRDKPWWRHPAMHPDSKYFETSGGRLCFNEMNGSLHILVNTTVTEEAEPIAVNAIRRDLYTVERFDESWFEWVRDAIMETHQMDPPKELLWDAIRAAARERLFHPVRDYLTSLEWDGLPRLHCLASDILKIPSPTPLQRRLAALWMISCVARAMDPGCKVDNVLILQGKQGLFKSTFFKILGGEWFRDTAMDLSNKDCYLQIADSWIYEWGEIAKIWRRQHADDVKAVITSTDDLFRVPYDREVKRQKRAMVFVGTTNDTEFLADPTGNRRFWVLPITQPIDREQLSLNRDQLWAEAVEAYRENTKDGWCLNAFEEADLAATLEQYEVHDSWQAVIAEYLARRSDSKGDLTMTEVLTAGLGLEVRDHSLSNQHRAGNALRKLGYEVRRVSKTDGRRVWRKLDR